MFNLFESSDTKKREAVMNRRLMMLRCAREAGYFDEVGSEPMPEIVVDGRGPDDYISLRSASDQAHDWVEQNATYYAQHYGARGPCSCAECVHYQEAAAFQRQLWEEQAVKLVCKSCAGFGEYLDDDGNCLGVCRTCRGTGVDRKYLKEPTECQHRNVVAGSIFYGQHERGEDAILCLDCGEIIGRGTQPA